MDPILGKAVEMILGSAVSLAIEKFANGFTGKVPDTLKGRAINAINSSIRFFFDKYKNEYGKECESFLARQENWEIIFESLFMDSPDLVAGKINPNGYKDSKPATIEVIEDFLSILKNEMRKDYDLEKSLAAKEHKSLTKDIYNIVHEINSKIPHSTSPNDLSIIVNSALVNQVGDLSTRLNTAIESQLVDKLEICRQGDETNAMTWVQKIREDSSIWSTLKPEIKAKILSFEGSLYLEMEDKEQYLELISKEAAKLADIPEVRRLLALIEFRKNGPEKAIQILGEANDINCIHLKAALFLEIGNIESAFQLLKLDKDEYNPNAETFRLLALGSILRRDIANARINIRKALELKPKWSNIRYTDAIIDYFSSICSVALPAHIPSWPTPVHPMLIHSDDISRELLNKAGNYFDEILNNKNLVSTGWKLLFIQTWRLACLANDPTKVENAIEYANKILSDNPSHPLVIIWALVHNYIKDIDPHIIALENRKTVDRNSLHYIIALLLCYIFRKKNDKAIELLNSHEDDFVNAKEENLFRYWKAKLFVLNGNMEDAAFLLRDAPNSIEFNYIRDQLDRETFSDGTLNENQMQNYQETNTPILLIEKCKRWSYEGYWNNIIAYQEQLLNDIGTSDVVCLITYALNNQKKYAECLSFIDSHKQVFPYENLPNDIRKIRCICTQAVGMLPAAIAEAEMLVEEFPSIENLLILGELYLSKGDLRGVANISEKIHTLPNVSSVQLLRLANIIACEDPQLGCVLWKKAVEKGVADDHIPQAVTIGYRLGLEDELAELLKRMTFLGLEGQSTVQFKSFEELIQMMEQTTKRNDEINELYRSCKLPIHIVSKELSLSLPRLFHEFSSDNENNGRILNSFPLLFRYGGKQFVNGFPDSVPKWRINIDITTLILSAHFDILNNLEAEFAPIRISPVLMPLLVQMREDLSDKQPSRTKANEKLQEFLKSRHISVFDSKEIIPENNSDIEKLIGLRKLKLLIGAENKNGYVLDYIPVQDTNCNPISDHIMGKYKKRFVGLGDILEALLNNGLIQKKQYGQIKKALIERNYDIKMNVPLSQGSIVICEIGLAQILLDMKIFGIACKFFDIKITKEEIITIEAENCSVLKNNELRNWITQLTDRIKRNIDNGKYQIIPKCNKEYPEHMTYDLMNASLIDLLSFERNSDDVVCISDRHMNSFVFAGNSVRIIDLIEILKALVVKNSISKSVYFDILHRMRASNFRYVPLEDEDVLYHLEQATIKSDKLVVTTELCILKRYISSCLYENDLLIRPTNPNGPPNEQGEANYIFQIHRTVMNVISKIWDNSNLNDTERNAQLSWVMDNLYIENLSQFYHDDKEDLYLYFAGITLSSMITNAFFMNFSVRQKYFNWIYNALLRNRFDSDPRLLTSTVDQLKKFPNNFKKNSQEDSHFEEIIKFLNLLFYDLPEPLKQELSKSQEFMESIGLKFELRITVGDMCFKKDDFVLSINKLFIFGNATLKNIQSDHLVEMEKGDGNVIHLIDKKTGKQYDLKDDIFDVLLNSSTEIEKSLLKNRHWFDCNKNDFTIAISEIITDDDPVRRFNKAQNWREKSASFYYNNIYTEILKNKEYTFNDLIPPDLKRLLFFFRFEDGSSKFHEIYNNAAELLIKEEQLLFAIERLADLPIPLHKNLFLKLKQIDENEKRCILKKLFRRAGSPVSRFHLLHLLPFLEKDKKRRNRIERILRRRLTGKLGRADLSAFIELLVWVMSEFSTRADFEFIQPALKLVLIWGHTNQLFKIFEAIGSGPEYIVRTFASVEKRISGTENCYEKAFFQDVTCPLRVNVELLLLKGLAYGLAYSDAELENEIRDELSSMFFQNIESKIILHADLYRDTSLCTDLLSSFLSIPNENAICRVLGQESVGDLSGDSLKKKVVVATEDLLKLPGDKGEWAILSLIIGNLPPYAECIVNIQKLLMHLDIDKLFSYDDITRKLAFSFATNQLRHYSDSNLYNHILELCIDVCKIYSNKFTNYLRSDEELMEFNESIKDLVAAAEAISVSKGVNEMWDEFASILDKMVDVWPALAKEIFPNVYYLCGKLPVSKTKGLWKLLVKMRAIL